MNFQKKTVLLAFMSVFCLSIKAESHSIPAKAYANATIGFIGSATTAGVIYIATNLLHKKNFIGALIAGIFTIPSGYTAYRAGLSAYNSYKKTYASKKSLENSSDNTVTQEKPNTEELSSSLPTRVQKATILGDTSL
ncbi:hypothetical protein H0X06_06990 [Candidatus Dependentiae bacterium]|nr:hypothetical protein [Candidatus Dependentiae bacterium]